LKPLSHAPFQSRYPLFQAFQGQLRHGFCA
jgi:hypothetical protein